MKSNPREVLDTFATKFKSDSAAGWNKIIQMNIEDENFHIIVQDQKAELNNGKAEKPDLTITMELDDLIAINSGQLNPTTAFMSGKIKSTGEMSDLMKFASLFNLI
ncbi:MAG: SCP2 sterol-binding domain-containing protein [Candidatus Hodarchaeota archaeon]